MQDSQTKEPINDNRNDDVLRMRTKKEIKARLQRVAALRGISVSDLAREGIMAHLQTEEVRHGFGVDRKAA